MEESNVQEISIHFKACTSEISRYWQKNVPGWIFAHRYVNIPRNIINKKKLLNIFQIEDQKFIFLL